MNLPSPFESATAFTLGPLAISWSVVESVTLTVLLTGLSWLLTRRIDAENPGRVRIVLEAIVTTVKAQLDEVMQTDSRPFLPLLGTLFIFIATANLAGLVPGFGSPTAKLETAMALGLVTFGAAQVLGVAQRGFWAYLASFAHPRWWMTPLNILSDLTRTLSLTLRLFGNVMSGEFVIAIVLGLAGFMVPVPLMALETMLGLIQAYIFTILAAVFIGGAVGTIEKG